MKKSDSNNTGVIVLLLLAIPFILGIVYLKLNADVVNVEATSDSCGMAPSVAVPDTSVTADIIAVEAGTVTDTMVSVETLGTDTRPPMEAGDEDGYWDGWYDGAETGERTRYDEHSNFASEQDRKIYAENYRSGYEKGFAESTGKHDVDDSMD